MTMTDTRPEATRPTPRGPNAWLVVGGIVTALLLITGAVSVAGWLGYRTETQHAVYQHVASTISIDADTGDITLMPGAAGEVAVTRRLHWSYEKPTIEESWDGQTLRVDSRCRLVWPGPGCGVDYTLAVPENVTAQLSTSTGDISVRAIRGELHLSTSTGDINVSGAAGSLTLNTSTGDITVNDATSSQVSASTGTGDVTLRLTAPPRTVNASTSTGDISIDLPRGETYQVQTDTGTGDVRVDVDRAASSPRVVTAGTGTGDIDIQYG